MSSAKHGHALIDKSFKTPKPCGQCAESIWGFGSKHKACSVCGMSFHKKCATAGMVLPKCSGEPAAEKPEADAARRGSLMTSGGDVVDLATTNDVLHQRVVATCASKDYESLKKFVANKKVVKPMLAQLDGNGCTPLQVAVSLGDIVVVETLLSAMDPGDVNNVDRFGNTALHEACKATSTKNDRVLEALLAAPGLDVTLANADENTALHYFCQKYSTVNCAQLGARLLELGGMPLVLKQNKNRETALHYAMFNPQFRLPMARFLIKATTGEFTSTAAATAARTTGGLARGSSLLAIDGASSADTSSGVDGVGNQSAPDDAGLQFINAQNSKGETALHYGVRMLRPDVVQLLLGAGADHRLKNQAGESPRELADVLIQKGADSMRGAAAAVTSEDPLPLIVAALDNAAFLREWLEQTSLSLGKLVGHFVRGGVTRDELTELTEQHLTDMAIKSAGDRIRIMKSIKELRKKTLGRDKKARKPVKKRTSASDASTTAAAASAAGAAAAASTTTAASAAPAAAAPAAAAASSTTAAPAAAAADVAAAAAPAAVVLEAPPAQPEFGSARMQNIKQQLEKLQYIKVDAGDWIDASSLEFLEELGSGACGVVMRGVYRHPKDGSVHPVAIKVLKEAETEKETEEFKKEFQILSAVKSPYMVHFFGASLHPQMAMIMELCTKGSVWKVLQTDSGIKVGWPQMLEWGVQLASGVAALHNNNPQIVHRDLKTLNLLLSDQWIIKVCDFGLSRFSTSCFDAVDHQVLTSDGFLFLDELLQRVDWRVESGRVVVTDWKGVTAATYNPKTAQLVYRQPLALGVNWGEQAFVELGTEAFAPTVAWAQRTGHAAVSVVATDNHDMYVSRCDAGRTHQFEKVALGRLPDLDCDSVRLLAAPRGGVALGGAAAPPSVDDMPVLDDLGANWRAELAPLHVLNLDRKDAQPSGELLDDAAACAQVALFLRVFGFWLGNGSLRVQQNAMPLVQFGPTKPREHVFLRQALVKFGLIAIEKGRTVPLNGEDDWWNDNSNFAAIKRGGVELCRMADERGSAPKIYQIADERWVRFFATEYEQDAKCFPQWVLHKLSAKGLRNVVWGLHLADGASDKSISTSSVLVRDQLEVVLLRAGFSTRSAVARDQWCVSWAAAENVTEPMVHLKRDVYSRFHKSGISWCFDMQSSAGANDGFVVVRRAARLSVDDLQQAKGVEAAVDQRLSNAVDSLSAQAAAVGGDDAAAEQALRAFGAGRQWVVFGASRATILGNSNVETLAKMRGTMAYCSPEAYFGERFTDKSDIYSVAVILWEMANRCIKGEYNRPFYEFPNMTLDFQIIIQVARKGKRPVLPPTTPTVLSDLITRCWAKERDTRPDAAAVRDELLAMQASYEKDPAPWNAALVGRAAEELAAATAAAAARGDTATPPATPLVADDDDDEDDDDEQDDDPKKKSSIDPESDDASSGSESDDDVDVGPAAASPSAAAGDAGPKKASSRRRHSSRRGGGAGGPERRPSKRDSAAPATATDASDGSDSDNKEGGEKESTARRRRVRKVIVK